MRTATEAPVEEPRTVSAAEPAVEIAGLAHSFGQLEVIERLELRLRQGEVVGLVGPSGGLARASPATTEQAGRRLRV